jgi:hypothetical protein
MVKRNFLRKFALGLCMTAFLVGTINIGTALAQSGGGTSSVALVNENPKDSVLFEKQREMDQYLFIDNIKKIEEMGFEVIYTGVSDNHVEVGITPYKEEYVTFLYDVFGVELVKVVDTEEAVLYDLPEEAPDAMPIEPDNLPSPALPIMDMGDDRSVSDIDSDEALLKEREQLMVDDENKLNIQIESVGGEEPTEGMDPELIWQTGIAENLPLTDIEEEATMDDTDIRLVAAEDMVTTTSASDVENEEKGLPTVSIIAIVAGGILIIGATTYTSVKRREVKKK